MYEDVTIRVKTLSGLIEVFLIKIELHQASTLSLYLFILIIIELTKHIKTRYHNACYL